MSEQQRELLGRVVRIAWLNWAKEQPNAKPSWLLPWEDLDEGQREVDCRIAESILAGTQPWYEVAKEAEDTIAQQQAQLIDADRRTLALQHENAQQQARIEELKLALDKADPLDPSFLRYLELEQALAAEREKSARLEAEAARMRWRPSQTQAYIRKLQGVAEWAEEFREAAKQSDVSPWSVAGLAAWLGRYDALTTQASEAGQ